MRLLVYYVALAFPVCLAITIMYNFYRLMPPGLNNNVFYNVHSFIRVVFFSLFMMGLMKDRFVPIIRFVLILYFVLVAANFILLQSPLKFSSRLLTTESILLILMSVLYFVRTTQDESETNWTRHPSLYVVAGIIFYEGVNFFTFLFYDPLSTERPLFGKATWTVHHITFVILCTLLAIAFRKSVNRVSHVHAGQQ